MAVQAKFPERVGGIPVLRGYKQKFKDDVEPLNSLVRIFSWMRPHDSDAEAEFVHRFIDSLDAERDEIGNRFIRIAGDDETLWSCHVDTVHHKGGYQKLVITKDSVEDYHIGVQRGADGGNCLGGDDGTGVWLMLQMIAAKKPGLYVFHRGEEKGCIGSRWIADKNPKFLSGITRAIAFDRRDYTNVITHQGGKRCCSQQFANHLSDQLQMGYKPDSTGMYTDTAQYVSHIPECTNLSVGYSAQHGPMESQNMTFALDLLKRVLLLEPKKLPTVRDPRTVEYSSANRGGYYNWRNDENERDTTKLYGVGKWSVVQQKMLYPGDTGYEYCGKGNIPNNHHVSNLADRRILHHTESRATANANSNLPAIIGSKTADSSNATVHSERLIPRKPEADSDLASDEIEKMRTDCGLSLMELCQKYPDEACVILFQKKVREEDFLESIYGNRFYPYFDSNI